ncbi:MAG: 4-hydroxythreonine-4-phosphate dehydrogenase PdxA [Woeseiaceae bacterium]|nr:4-hydroxythreonine-4-phosphate dehydrogenase PdxA [Woeseiaceae bacterium]
MAADKPLVVTAGEPAGIGPELCLALAQQPLPHGIVVVADAELLRRRAAASGLDIRITEVAPDDAAPAAKGELRVISTPLAAIPDCGRPLEANAEVLLNGLRLAVDGCLDGRFAGLVTAPLQKSVINDAGIAFTGHTEYLAEITGAETPVMLLVAGDLRVALATTHLPLREVPDHISEEGLNHVLDVLLHDLQAKFGIESPEIVVCGLNPHAGEGGHLGTEDDDIIAPVVAEYAAAGHRVRGPVPADTAFTPAGGHKDAVLAMYHDQGLPVLKYAGFGHAVNVTLGLPIVRTSVDHGTALDIAGTGKADAGSLRAAVRLAAELAAK